MIKFLLHQEEEVQGRRSRNPSFSKSINPQPVSNRKGGRRSRTASEGDSWTVVSNDNQQRSVHSQGQHLYSGRHSSGSMGTSVANTSNSKTNYGFAKVQPYHKVQAHLVLYNLLRYWSCLSTALKTKSFIYWMFHSFYRHIKDVRVQNKHQLQLILHQLTSHTKIIVRTLQIETFNTSCKNE